MKMANRLHLINPATTKKEKNIENLKLKLDSLNIEGKIDQNNYWHMMALINRVASDTTERERR